MKDGILVTSIHAIHPLQTLLQFYDKHAKIRLLILVKPMFDVKVKTAVAL